MSNPENQQKDIEQEIDGIKRHPVNQGGHEQLGGHGGQQSGGMGGMHGGDLHDIGSAHSGMTGRGGMGGNDDQRQGDAGNARQAGADDPPVAEVQQSAQREGMGRHRHGDRGNEQAEDATDADDLGSHDSSAAETGSLKPAQD